MTGLHLPHTLDIYVPPIDGGSAVLARAAVAGYFDPISTAGRIQLQDVSANKLATLWLDIALQSLAADGVSVYWREAGSWWTMRGVPDVYDGGAGGITPHIEVTVAANVVDTLIAGRAAPLPLSVELTGASAVTAVKVEVSTAPDFATLAASAHSGVSQAGWYYANGTVWTPIPASGLPSASVQRVAYLPTGLLPAQHYYVRWTPFAGATGMTAQLNVAAT